MQRVESLKIQVTAIQNINRTGFRDQFVEDVDFMHSSLGDGVGVSVAVGVGVNDGVSEATKVGTSVAGLWNTVG